MYGVGIIQVFKNPVPKSSDWSDAWVARTDHTDYDGNPIQAFGTTIGMALVSLARELEGRDWPGVSEHGDEPWNCETIPWNFA